MVALCCLSLFFIVGGLISIFAHDLAWKINEKMFRAQGIVSQRTPEWDQTSTIMGIIILAFGIWFLLSVMSGKIH
jgi:hypothetical protein